MSCECVWEGGVGGGCGWSYLQCLVSVRGRGVWVELPAVSRECAWEGMWVELPAVSRECAWEGVWVELPAMSCECEWEGVWVELPAMSCEWVWEGCVGGGVGGATCNVL